MFKLVFRTASRILVLLAGLSVLASCSSTKNPQVNLTPGPKPSQELFDEIAASDSALFAAVFDSCDPGKVAELVTEDLEFYHDKWGLTATSGAQFVESIRNLCERQRQGVDFDSRRELVEGSMQVYPLNNYGAIQVGVHRFYAVEKGKPDRLTETGKFTQVWKKEEGRWRVARILSYDHQLAE